MLLWNVFKKKETVSPEAQAVLPDPELELRVLEEGIHAAGDELSAQLRDLAAELDQKEKELAEAQEVESALSWAVREMETVCKKLEEVEAIGVWFRSDGCSDNRDRRSGLREASCDCYAARGNLGKVEALRPQEESLLSLSGEIEELEKSLDALAESVSDVMGEDTPFSSDVSRLQKKAENLHNQLLPLAQKYRVALRQAQERVISLKVKRRALLKPETENYSGSE